MTEALVILGAGGHARMLAAHLLASGAPLVGCLAPSAPEGTWPETVPWLGTDEEWLGVDPHAALLVNGIGSVASTKTRRVAFERAVAAGARFADFVHRDASVAEAAETGEGLVVLPCAVIQPHVRIGDNVLINSGAVVEHDVTLGAHVHIAPRACVCGNATIGEGAHVGAGSVILQGVAVGGGAVVGAGAVVTRPVAPGATVIGNPARPVVPRNVDA